MSFLPKKASMKEVFGVNKPIIGMIHLLPLPGSVFYNGKMKKVVERAIEDAKALEAGGVNALEIENFCDMTYFPGRVGPETVAAVTHVASRVSQEVNLPIGICVLTDPVSALAVAHAVGAAFIRATVYIEAVMDVSGVIQGCAHEVQRLKKLIADSNTRVFADVQIKHSVPLAPRPIEHSAKDAAYFLADAIIISGSFTGEETPVEKVKRVKEYLPQIPILVGSGTTKENAKELFRYADGAIVGTTFKKEGVTTNPVDIERVREFMRVVKKIRGNEE